MTKGLSHYLRKAWKNPVKSDQKERQVQWRKEGSIVKLEKPTRIDRARALGYKAKKGVFVVRVKLIRGGHKRTRPKKARRSKRLHSRLNLRMNYKEIAEQRAARKYNNCEVLNSYWIGKDGEHYFYEVILVDRNAPEIKSDRQLKFVTRPANKRRSLRALTSAGQKARGLRNSSVKSPKVRPSLGANRKRGN